MQASGRGHLPPIRWGLAAVALLLGAVGVATVYSASYELGSGYLERQAVWLLLGLVLMVAAIGIDHQRLVDAAPVLWALGLASLVAVLWLGKEAGGARSWLGVGSWRVQPSEFVRLATVLLLARYFAGAEARYLSPRRIAAGGLIVAAPMALLALQPDLGGAVMFLPVLAGMVFVCGVRLRLVAVVAVIVALAAGAAWHVVLLDYQRERVATFLAPETDPLGGGYQLRQSKIAVGSGELTGKGYLQGTQSQLRFLPARHTDFIFAVLAEEWGFLGVLTVLALFALYVVEGARVARRARDRVGILLVVGLLSTFCVFVLYNTAMVVGLLPITGIPLPFLSYGGSFTLANFIATGLILGVDLRRYVNR